MGAWGGVPHSTSMYIRTLTLQPCTAAGAAVTGVCFSLKTYVWCLWCPSRCCWCPLTCWVLSVAHEWVGVKAQRATVVTDKSCSITHPLDRTWDSSSLLGPKASFSHNQHSCRTTHWFAGWFSISQAPVTPVEGLSSFILIFSLQSEWASWAYEGGVDVDMYSYTHTVHLHKMSIIYHTRMQILYSEWVQKEIFVNKTVKCTLQMCTNTPS